MLRPAKYCSYRRTRTSLFLLLSLSPTIYILFKITFFLFNGNTFEYSAGAVPSLRLSSRVNPLGRVAVCLAGQLRSFAEQGVQDSIRQHVIRPLAQSGYAVDLFFHVPCHTKVSATRKKDPMVALLRYQPASISYFEDEPPTKLAPWRKCKNATNIPTAFPFALLRGEQCMSHILAREKTGGFEYEWVYKSRPDVAFGAPVTVPSELRNDTLYVNMHIPGTSTHSYDWLRRRFPYSSSLLTHPVGDHVFAASRHVAQEAFKATHALRDCAIYRMPSGKLNPEVILTYWLAMKKIKYQTMPWFWMLVRDGVGPECYRVQWIRDSNHTHNESLTRRCLHFKRTGQL